MPVSTGWIGPLLANTAAFMQIHSHVGKLFMHPSLNTHARAQTNTGRTSFVVLAVGTDHLHGDVTASSSPSRLADTMPAAGFQGAAAIVVTQAWTTLWVHNKSTTI